MSRKITLFNREIEVKIWLVVLTIIAIFALIFTGIYFSKLTITGFVTVEEEKSYLDELNLEFNANGSYNWFLGHSGDLKSVKLSGSLSSNASAKVYLKKGNKLKLIFDSEQTEEGGLGGITGFVVEDKDKEKKDKEQNKTDKSKPPFVNETVGNETIQTTSPIQNETIDQTITNETIINETNQSSPLPSSPPAKKNISINLSYNSGTAFDPDDDGIESTAGVIDFTVANSAFNWDVNESLLCTKWETYNLDSFESTVVCYGNEDCCAFVGVLPSSSNWNDVFYSNYGKYGAGLENLIYAQIIFYNVSLDPENPYADIITSNLTSLGADYYYAYSYFNEECVETCSLSGYKEIFYELIVEVENGVLKLDNITYSILEKITKVNVNLNVEDSSGLIPAILNIYAPNGSLVEGNQVEPDVYTIEVIPDNKVIEKVIFYDVNITKTLAANIGIDNVSLAKANISNVNISRVFALDPSKLNFSSATLTGVATAPALYKCKDWDFYNEDCLGDWGKIADLIIGEEYNITITPGDPGFAEGSPSENITIVPIGENITCREFKDNVLWTSNYSISQKGSTKYQTWKIGTNCTEAGGYNCSLQNISIRTRSIHTDFDESNSSREGYVQISNPDESICDSPEQGVYSRYLAYETLTGEGKKLSWYCGKNKNPNAKCAVEIITNYNDNVSCYGIKSHASQYFLVDVFEVAYSWCWDSTYNSENPKKEINYG